MKHIQNFEEFVNESLINESSAATMAKKLKEFSAELFMEEKSDIPEIIQDTTEICKILGDSPKNVFSIDEYCEEPGADKVYSKLQDLDYDEIPGAVDIFSGDAEIRYNQSAKVIEYVDMIDQYTLYWFTPKSNF